MVHGPDPRRQPDARGRAGAERGVEDQQVGAHGRVGEHALVVGACVGGAGERRVLAAGEGCWDVDDGYGARVGRLWFGVCSDGGELIDAGDMVCEGLRGLV